MAGGLLNHTGKLEEVLLHCYIVDEMHVLGQREAINEIASFARHFQLRLCTAIDKDAGTYTEVTGGGYDGPKDVTFVHHDTLDNVVLNDGAITFAAATVKWEGVVGFVLTCENGGFLDGYAYDYYTFPSPIDVEVGQQFNIPAGSLTIAQS